MGSTPTVRTNNISGLKIIRLAVIADLVMLLRVTVIALSLLLHAFAGWALWRPAHLQAFDMGDAQELFLEPQGLDIPDVRNVGDDLQSVEAQEQVAAHEPPPPPLSSEPSDKLANVPDAAPDELAATAPLERSDATQPAPESVPDVIASEESAVEQEMAALKASPSEPIENEPVGPEATLDETKAGADVVSGSRQLDESVESQTHSPNVIDEPDIPAADQSRLTDEVESAALETSREHRLPLPEINETRPAEIELVAQPDQAVLMSEQSSGEEDKGGDATVTSQYLGALNRKIEQSKINPRSRTTGVVVIGFTIARDGSLLSKDVLSSSGSDVLDRAALATLDRAAPFPPLPPAMSQTELTFKQSFRYLVR